MTQDDLDLISEIIKYHVPEKAEYILDCVRVYGQDQRGAGWREGFNKAQSNDTHNEDLRNNADNTEATNPYIYERRT